MSREEWALIESDEVKPQYQVSNMGRVRNTRGKNICLWKVNTGYIQCKLKGCSGKWKYLYVHRLVAKHFLDNKGCLPQVGHKDGDKTNNYVDNLYWTNNSDNTQHGYDTEAYKTKKRSHIILSKCKDTGSIEEHKSIRSAAESLGYNRKTITAILKKDKITNNYNHVFCYKDLDEGWF